MEVRDRLLEYRLKVGYNLDAFDKNNRISHVKVEVDNDREFMHPFFKDVSNLWKILNEMGTDVQKLVSTHAKILSSSVIDDSLQQVLEEIMRRMKHNSNLVCPKIKQIEQSIKNDQYCCALPEVIRVKKLQHATLSRKFVDVMNLYNTAQVEYRDRCKKRINRQLEITGQKLEDEEVENMLEGRRLSISFGVLMDIQKEEEVLREIQTRHQDILKLEASIRDLHELFVEIATLVHMQGTTIDRIDVHVSHSVDYVQAGLRKVEKSSQYHKQARYKKIINFGILITTVVFLTVFVLCSIFI